MEGGHAYPLLCSRINVYAYNESINPTMKGMKFLIHAARWMNLENIVLHEINHTGRINNDSTCMNYLSGEANPWKQKVDQRSSRKGKWVIA